MNTSYTLIAYKPNSSVYYRGNWEASWNSNCIVRANLTWEKLKREWAEIKSITLDTSEEGYSISVFLNIDGRSEQLLGWTNDIDFQCYGDELDDDIRYSDEYIKAAELVEIQDVMDKAKATIKEKEEIEKKQMEARIKAAEQDRIRHMKNRHMKNKAYEDEERRRYEQLKAKFENK